MKKPSIYQYFSVESRRTDEPEWPWECRENCTTLRTARTMRNNLALQYHRMRPEETHEWRIMRVVKLVEEMDPPHSVVGGARG